MDRYSSKYDRFIGGKNAVAKNFSHRRVEHSATILRPADAFLRGRKKRRDVSVKWQGRGEEERDTGRSRERKGKKCWFAWLRNLEMGVCRRSADASNPRFFSFPALAWWNFFRNRLRSVEETIRRRGRKRYFFEEFPSLYLEKKLTRNCLSLSYHSFQNHWL